MRYFINFLSLILCVVVLTSTATKNSRYKLKKLVIDAGHGGKDPGCMGKKNKEAEITLKVVLELGKLITENCNDVQVIYTRKENKFVELHDRAGIANKNNADFFISIHCNAVPSGTLRGSETYVMGTHKTESNLEVAKRENAVVLQEENYLDKYDGFDPESPMAYILLANQQNAFVGNSLRFAERAEKYMHEQTGLKTRGVKQAGFLVLWKTTMPSVLIEIGFLSHPDEETFLSKADNQHKIAMGIYKAFKEYKEDLEGMN